MGDIHLCKGLSYELVARHLNFSRIGLSTKKANPKIRKIEGSTDFYHRNVLCEDDLALELYISMEKSATIFSKISRTFNLPDLWGLPSWYL